MSLSDVVHLVVPGHTIDACVYTIDWAAFRHRERLGMKPEAADIAFR